MSLSNPWKRYFIVGAIIFLLVGVGVGWVAKPPTEEVTPTGWVSPEDYEEALNARAYPFPGMPLSNYTGTLRVFTWEGLGREEEMWWNEGPWGFNKIYPNVDIEWVYFTDEPHAMSMLQMDPDYADVIEVCGGQFKLIDEDLIEPLNHTMVPLMAEFFPEWEYYDAFWKDGELYAVPFEFGYTSLTYNIDMFEEWNISEALWDDTAILFEYIPELDDQIWMYDSVIEIMDLAATHVGYNITVEDMIEWTNDTSKFTTVTDALAGFKPKIETFYTGVEEAYTALMTEDCAAVIGWCDMYAVVRAGLDEEFGTGDDLNVGFSFFSPMLSWGSAYTINAGLKQRDPELYAVAHAFLNAVVAREACANKIMEWYTGAPNRYSYEIVREEFPEFIPVIEELRLEDPAFFAEESAYWIEPPTYVVDKWETFWLGFKA